MVGWCGPSLCHGYALPESFSWPYPHMATQDDILVIFLMWQLILSFLWLSRMAAHDDILVVISCGNS